MGPAAFFLPQGDHGLKDLVPHLFGQPGTLVGNPDLNLAACKGKMDINPA